MLNIARIPPQLDADGQPLPITPATGGTWLREADGGLTPADEATAAAAGLLQPEAAPATLDAQPE